MFQLRMTGKTTSMPTAQATLSGEILIEADFDRIFPIQLYIPEYGISGQVGFSGGEV